MAERAGSVKGVKVTGGKPCLYCQGCGRYLGTVVGDTSVVLKCPVCKDTSLYSVCLPGV